MQYSFLPSTSTTSTSQTTAPSWAPQVGALSQAFSGAQNAYNTQRAMGPYTGDYVAAPNAAQYGAVDQAVNFAAGPASGVGNYQINNGMPLMASGINGATGALGGLTNFANSDMTGANIGAANTYAGNPWIDQAVNAATYNAERSASENDIPSLYRSAASSGGLNSDRAALAQGVVQRGLAENKQNLGASMRNSAWNTGLDAAMTGNNQRLSALTSAGSLGSTLGNLGSGMLSQGISDASSLSNLYSGAGSSLNSLNQSFIDNALAKYQGNIQNMWSPVQNLYSIAGANNWGQTTNGTSTTNSISPYQNQQTAPGLASYLGAGLGLAGSVLGTAVGGRAGGTVGGALARYMAPSVFGSSGGGGMQFPIANSSGGFSMGGW